MGTKLLERSVAASSHADGPSHPLSVGDIVVIFCIALFGRPLIEGRAIIVAPIPGIRDFYQVQFIGDPRVRQRYAHLELQSNPERMLEIQLDQWRDSMEPEILEEFFPNDL